MRFKVFILLLILSGCQPKEQEIKPTFSSSLMAYWKDKPMGSVWDFVPKEEIHELSIGWEFHGWDTLKGIGAEIPNLKSGLKINLPHRIQTPNSNIWYSGDFELENGVLIVGADDGQQVWVDDNPILPDKNHVYQIPKTNGKITIRVINNAVAGGLGTVKWIPIATWEKATINFDSEWFGKVREDKHMLWQKEVDFDEMTSKRYPIWFSDPVILPYDKDQILLRWTGEKGHESWIFYGKDSANLHLSTLAIEDDGVYSAFLPNEKIQHYRFEMSETKSPIYTSNSVESKIQTSFALWADSQGGWKSFEKILEQIKEANPDFTVGIGDLVGNGRLESEYQKLLQYLSPIAVPHYLLPGNHDYDGSYQTWIPEPFQKVLKADNQKNYYSWQSGPCAFIALDPNENFPVGIPANTEQFEWFQQEIKSKKWKDAAWKIILVHQPPFSQGWIGYHGEQSIENLLKPVWESGMADLVISGHTHDYERLILDHPNGKTAILILGGAGGGLESEGNKEDFPIMDKLIREHHFGRIDATNKKLEFKAVNQSGKVIDSFSLEK
ncbi:metallophosphoesterase family protein [Aquiflexum gelatinilyticum]|uniref:metallophosphoesterase family protein n=1 Tax=Aquiflexum gelatinilyticum TaxID=2961943 RepID=UPI00216A2966|nr:metallophosphoesterase [Aquiflexum gelatinilyticum]MCS4434363.1 metallophosphoesterase [Aquiflexum gelatinilyticum]